MSEKVRRGLVGDVSRVAKVFAVWQRICRRRPVVDKRMVELRLNAVYKVLGEGPLHASLAEGATIVDHILPGAQCNSL